MKSKIIIFIISCILFISGLFLILLYQDISKQSENIEKQLIEIKGKIQTASKIKNIPEPKEEIIEIPQKMYLNIPLEPNLQDFLITQCENKNIEVALVLAVIDIESKFDKEAISYTGDYGLMGINVKAQQITPEQALNPEFNISKGTDILSNLNAKYGDYTVVLASYNMGEYGYKNARKNGIFSIDYSIKVLSKFEEYKSITQ